MPPVEMVRLANELKLPLKHKDTVVFPRGMSPSSFGKKPDQSIIVEAETVEAEIE
jgi:hypothetical protein